MRNSEERKYLSEQIINHQRLVFQIFTFSVIVAVGILGWGLQIFPESGAQTSGLAPFLLLAPTAIILSCAFIISGIREEIFRWGAYIIIFHESDGVKGYESRLDKLRDKRGSYKESYTPIVVVYWVLSIICIALFAKAIDNAISISNGWIAFIIPPLGLLTWWSVIFCNIPGKEKRSKFRDEWSEIKQDDQTNQADNPSLKDQKPN